MTLAGPSSAKLSLEQITSLRKLQAHRRFSVKSLAEFMGVPFRWQVLSGALRGRRIRWINHHFIVTWIDQHTGELVKP